MYRFFIRVNLGALQVFSRLSTGLRCNMCEVWSRSVFQGNSLAGLPVIVKGVQIHMKPG